MKVNVNIGNSIINILEPVNAMICPLQQITLKQSFEYVFFFFKSTLAYWIPGTTNPGKNTMTRTLLQEYEERGRIAFLKFERQLGLTDNFPSR